MTLAARMLRNGIKSCVVTSAAPIHGPHGPSAAALPARCDRRGPSETGDSPLRLARRRSQSTPLIMLTFSFFFVSRAQRLDIRGRVKVLHGQNHKSEEAPLAL